MITYYYDRTKQSGTSSQKNPPNRLCRKHCFTLSSTVQSICSSGPLQMASTSVHTNPSLQVSYIRMCMPGFDIARRCLGADASGNLQKTVRTAWEQRHTGLRTKDFKKLPPPKIIVSACVLAGFCLRNPRGVDIIKYVLKRSEPPQNLDLLCFRFKKN